MLKFALKNMLTKKVKLLLIVLSIVISASVGILAYNVAQQVNEGLINTTSSYDTIVGPSGSATQLAMNTLFFTDKPLGTISYEYVEKLQSDPRVNVAIPFAMGDSYNSAKIVGTKSAFLDGKPVSSGRMFEKPFEAVVGSSVAEKFGLKPGDEMITSHGLSEHGEEHDATPLLLVGILEKTNTAYDTVVFTDIETVWMIHGDEHGEEDNETGKTSPLQGEENEGGHHLPDGDGEEDHGDHAEEGTVCAILLRSKTLSYAEQIKSELGADPGILTITPAEVIREIIENVDLSRRIVYILCVIILVMNIFVISTITVLNMYDSQKDIALMRLIGIGTGKVNVMFLIQNAVVGLFSTAISFGVSRLCLYFLGDFAAGMGIVLDSGRIYPLEWAIMAAVFVISVLPTFICTICVSRRDIIRN